MLNTLIKKQFNECFKSFFVNPKNGKPRSKGGKFAMVLFYIFILLLLLFCFAMMEFSLYGLIEGGSSWLYFTLVGIVSILMGVIGSAFSTYTTLYLAKDNDLLLSFPIKPSSILYSRIVLVFGLGLIYASSPWVPAMVIYIIFAGFNVVHFLYQIVSLFAIALFVTTFSCALGFIVAKIAGKLKNKGFISALMIGVFLAFYYYASFNLENIMQTLMANTEAVGDKLLVFANLLCQLGKGAVGETFGLLIFVGVSLVLFGLCFFILSRSFIKIATSMNQSGTSTKKEVAFEKQSSVKTALLKKEIKRFTSSTIYLLNCGLGLVFTIGLTVLAYFKFNDFSPLLDLVKENMPELLAYLPLAIVLLISLMLSMNCISTPSISLEGKNLWILKSLPVSPYDVIEAKEKLHVLFNGIPAVICSVALCILFKVKIYDVAIELLICILLIELNAVLGLIFNLLRPNFNWTNEAQPIKQSMNLIFVMLISWICVAGIGVGAFFLRDKLSVDMYVAIVFAVLVILVAILKRWLKNKGSILFKEL